MQWCNEPILFVRSGHLESNRMRLMAAEKSACAVRVLEPDEPMPDYVLTVNPRGVYPVWIGAGVTLFGPALDELMHERFPEPQLLPHEAVLRSYVRFLTYELQRTYAGTGAEQRAMLGSIEAGFDPHRTFLVGRSMSVVDIAVAAMLFELPRIGYHITPGTPFAGYARMLLGRPSFQVLKRPHLPYGQIETPTTRYEGVA